MAKAASPTPEDDSAQKSDLLADLARGLAAESNATAVLQRVVDVATVQIDGADRAGVTILERRSVSTPVTSDEFVRLIDEQQYQTGEGPCLTAAADHQPIVVVPDLTTDQRWPRFSAAVAELGVRSMLSFQLYTDTESIGALNIYAAAPHAFSDDAVRTGALLAAHAAVAAVAASHNDHLKIALESRDIIGQAKGILMERYRITADQAFDLLVVSSQRTHRKLNEVAAELSSTGALAAR